MSQHSNGPISYATPARSRRAPVWPWVLGGVVLVLGLMFVLLLFVRVQRPSAAPMPRAVPAATP